MRLFPRFMCMGIQIVLMIPGLSLAVAYPQRVIYATPLVCIILGNFGLVELWLSPMRPPGSYFPLSWAGASFFSVDVAQATTSRPQDTVCIYCDGTGKTRTTRCSDTGLKIYLRQEVSTLKYGPISTRTRRGTRAIVEPATEATVSSVSKALSFHRMLT